MRSNPPSASQQGEQLTASQATPNFTKDSFTDMFTSRFGLPRKEGSEFFDLIGEQMSAAMDAGGTVKVFGIGALKVVKKRGESGETRMRFRPRKAKDSQEESFAAII